MSVELQSVEDFCSELAAREKAVVIDREPVVGSSNVVSAGYDAETQVLDVEFTGGAVYRYTCVGETTYNSLMAAPSVGRFICSQIKGRFPFTKI